MRAALTALFVLAAIPAAQARQPYEGAWAASIENCKAPNDGNIKIIGKRYYEHEGQCSIRKVVRSGDEYRLDLACEGEGERWTKRRTLMPRGHALLVDGAALALVRCKADPRPPNWPDD